MSLKEDWRMLRWVDGGDLSFTFRAKISEKCQVRISWKKVRYWLFDVGYDSFPGVAGSGRDPSGSELPETLHWHRKGECWAGQASKTCCALRSWQIHPPKQARKAWVLLVGCEECHV